MQFALIFMKVYRAEGGHIEGVFESVFVVAGLEGRMRGVVHRMRSGLRWIADDRMGGG